jgi:hypothetical protein
MTLIISIEVLCLSLYNTNGMVFVSGTQSFFCEVKSLYLFKVGNFTFQIVLFIRSTYETWWDTTKK